MVPEVTRWRAISTAGKKRVHMPSRRNRSLSAA
jgi:hypothetical protein